MIEHRIVRYEKETTSQLSKVKTIKKQLREAQGFLREQLERDPEYKEVKQRASEANRALKAHKDRLLATASNQKLVKNIEEVKSELEAHTIILQQNLFDYVKENNVWSIKDPTDGERKEIIKNFKIG